MKENYIEAVASYFSLRQNSIKKKLHNDLEDVDENDSQLLLSYGHPRSLAYTYGYRYSLRDYLSTPILKKFNKITYRLFIAYICLMNLIHLYLFDCLIKRNDSIDKIININFIKFTIYHPFGVLCLLFIIYIIISSLLVSQIHYEKNLNFSLSDLEKLPCANIYRNRNTDNKLIIFIICAGMLLFGFYPTDVDQLTNCFFQVYFGIFIAGYFYDITHRMYTKKYLSRSSLLNIYTLTTILLFLIRGNELSYTQYKTSEFPMIIAATVIIGICLSKLVMNAYYYLEIYQRRNK